MYWLGMSMFEGNLGTAFRHKSTLLPILILIIALQSAESRAHTLNQKTWETGLKRKEKKREN
jgi:hypothetical protein